MKAIESGGIVFEVDEAEVVVRPAAQATGGRTTLGSTPLLDLVPELQNTIRTACRMAFDAFAEVVRPTELKVKFGVKIGGEVGVPMISKGTTEATFEIEATWR